MKAWLRELGILTSEESTKVITEENFNENQVDELVCGPKLRFYAAFRIHLIFDVDPDPDSGIHIWEKWIRIRILGSTFP